MLTHLRGESNGATVKASYFTKASERQLQWWDEHNYIQVAIVGHNRYWTKNPLEQAALIHDLRAKNVPLRFCSIAAQELLKNGMAEYLVMRFPAATPKPMFLDRSAAFDYAANMPGPVVLLKIRRAPAYVPDRPPEPKPQPPPKRRYRRRRYNPGAFPSKRGVTIAPSRPAPDSLHRIEHNMTVKANRKAGV